VVSFERRGGISLPDFDEVAVANLEDSVSQREDRRAMRHDARACHGEPGAKAFYDAGLRRRVEVRRRLVEEVQPRVAQERACTRLLFSPRTNPTGRESMQPAR